MTLEKIQEEARKIGLRDFYSYARNFYFQKNGFKSTEVSEGKRETLDELISNEKH